MINSLRDHNALAIASAHGNMPLDILVCGLTAAIEEAKAEGITDLGRDPAIMAMAAFISFQTHTDTSTPSDYRAALERCAERLAERKILQ